ncbi:uncharacterized protein LOC110440378 [Mizuhopecten yessoensis]|uniref:uncharacterized protein LOC110440378 n=1 Tax=Mizuhopecten yessoensis TaxID=6573 RepID=UPI000B45B333|nr:uncharacterized protein LOC110440378 [Mizuhopecten yessoensis]
MATNCLDATDDNKKEERTNSQEEHHGQIEKTTDKMNDREQELARRELELSRREDEISRREQLFLMMEGLRVELEHGKQNDREEELAMRELKVSRREDEISRRENAYLSSQQDTNTSPRNIEMNGCNYIQIGFGNDGVQQKLEQESLMMEGLRVELEHVKNTTNTILECVKDLKKESTNLRSSDKIRYKQ